MGNAPQRAFPRAREAPVDGVFAELGGCLYTVSPGPDFLEYQFIPGAADVGGQIVGKTKRRFSATFRE